ncbi:hypothetical protein SynWH8101_1040 [Synechococcus sp. WH 8101]|uniref:sacsin N-terminal ATP-binding-like domain-containing protein n=1 Tax=Synechococcus sp. WH 8101 TaxID=59932 RepID=UPI0010237593|nr:hypothetical protein [Synechococcus sp. WH 8101]QBE68628.1 hypothetical protein SynWH8101_1040 [Synechococcus sp. WH 8101]QNI44850.1 hypothetical protein SynRCC2555_01064 [Synechococcus sp. WH 8101]
MNRQPPEYFEPIRQAAERRWQQLEADPELAGPWHQLFKQVQSPRHVLSELLQNADDAGATEASARVVNGVFEFTHNGEDFQPDHFASLCRFGYSNKRSLHTIGFRGIGFKSTFSLGPVVGIRTPSLSVFFEKDRFTLPCWYEDTTNDQNKTCILVEIQDKLRQAELAKNLAEWKQSPISLLFFRNIRRLTLDGHQLFWHSRGAGPVHGSEWYSLNDTESDRYLLARSEPEEFPSECVDEIKHERILGADSDFSLPPSRVELVLGASAGIYVVLPTSVKPDLPFACNGPFMQDPARVKIKDPETSPTNRWLLARVGRLAASCMVNWLANQALDMSSRAQAYQLIPKAGLSGSRTRAYFSIANQGGIEDECVEEVSQSFFHHIQHQRIVLAHDGCVEGSGSCIALEKEVQDIWESSFYTGILDPKKRKLISTAIPRETVDLLQKLEQIEKISRVLFCSLLQQIAPPNPGKEKLLRLWVYVSGEFTKPATGISLDELAIVPAADKNHLVPPRSTVRLGNSKSQLDESDLHWLASYVLFVDREWLIYLVDQDTDYALQQGKYSSITAKEAALSLLQRMGLADGTDTTKLVERIATSLSESRTLDGASCVRLAHICARLDCRVPKNFPYITQSGKIRHVARGVCHDQTKTIQGLLPSSYTDEHFIANDYWAVPHSCSTDEWDSWIASGKPGLKSLPPIAERKHEFRHSKDLLDHLQSNYGEPLETSLFPYKWERYSATQRYFIIDHDFDQQILAHWLNEQSVDTSLAVLVRYILETSSTDWFTKARLEIYQTNTNGLREKLVEGHEISASWLRRIRNSACIPDTRGNLCKPAELLRRSEETEPLIGVERFIEKRFDNEANDDILNALGVSAALPGPQLLLSLLNTLTALECPPRAEALKLYEQLDKLYLLSKSEEQSLILDAFKAENLILTEQGSWSSPLHVFISADGLEGSGIATVVESVRHLSLWRQLGLRERPDADSAVALVSAISLNSDLSTEVLNLLQILLRRFTDSVIDRCGVWLSLSKQLKLLTELPYGLSDEAFDTNSLFDETLDRCADLRFVDGYSLDLLLQQGTIQEITNSLSYQLTDAPDSTQLAFAKHEWLQTFGQCVSKIKPESTDKSNSVNAGIVLSQAPIYFRNDLRVTPILDGKPIGLAIEKDGALISSAIYVKQLPGPRLANLIPIIIGEYLQSADLQAAAAYCYERSDEIIREYFRVNYNVILTAPNFALAATSAPQAESTFQVTNPEEREYDHGSIVASQTSPEQSNQSHQEMFAKELEQEPIRTAHKEIPSFLKPNDFETVFTDAPASHSSTPSPEEASLGEYRGSALLGAADSPHEPSASPDINSDHQGRSESQSQPSEEPGVSAQYGVIAQYAQSLDLQEVSDGVFRGSDQTTLRRQRGELFPWILEAPSGLEIKRFLVRTSPIVASPLELDTVAFGLLERLPDGHSILLPDTSGRITEISGIQLQSMISDGRIKVYPSSYRLAAT